MDGFNWGNIGTGLRAFGTGLQGGDPSAVIQGRLQGIEREERKGNIAALMENMGIGGNRRALLDMLPQEAQLSALMGMQEASRAQAAAAAQAQRDAEAQAAANAEAMALMFPDTTGPQTAWDAAVSMPPMQPTFGPTPETQIPVESVAGGQPVVSDPSRLMDRFPIAGQDDPQMWINQDQPIGVPVPSRQGVTNLGDVVAGQRAVADPVRPTLPAPTTPMADIGPMPTQMGGDQGLGGDPTLLNWMRMASDPNLGAGQKQYLDMMIADRMGGDETALMQNYGMYAQQEQAAGRQPSSFMEYQQALKAGTSVTVNTGQTEIGPIPSGWETYVDPETQQRAMRPISGGPVATKLAEGIQMSDADFATYEADTNVVLDILKGVLSAPGLEGGTGFMQGKLGGYNQDVANFIAKHEQLAGNVFLEAFESLKGGGPITDLEGQKAENAKARLQRTQSADEYRSALMELYEIIDAGLQRAKGGQLVGDQALTDEQLFEKYGQ